MKYIEKPRIINVLLIPNDVSVKMIQDFIGSFGDSLVHKSSFDDYSAKGPIQITRTMNKVGNAGSDVIYFFPFNSRMEQGVSCIKLEPGKYFVRINDKYHNDQHFYEVWNKEYLESEYKIFN